MSKPAYKGGRHQLSLDEQRAYLERTGHCWTCEGMPWRAKWPACIVCGTRHGREDVTEAMAELRERRSFADPRGL